MPVPARDRYAPIHTHYITPCQGYTKSRALAFIVSAAFWGREGLGCGLANRGILKDDRVYHSRSILSRSCFPAWACYTWHSV